MILQNKWGLYRGWIEEIGIGYSAPATVIAINYMNIQWVKRIHSISEFNFFKLLVVNEVNFDCLLIDEENS